MSHGTKNDTNHGIRDGLLVAVIVLVCTFVGNAVAYRLNGEYGRAEADRHQVVEKTGEIWKGIVDYRTYLDKISQVEFGGFVTSSTQTAEYAKQLTTARSNALKAKARLKQLIGDNSFYIGPTLTREASLYVNYLEGYYQQRDQIYYTKTKPNEFEVKMLENTQKLLNQAGNYLTARGSYAAAPG